MWRTSEEITADLRSGDPERMAAGLDTLEFHLDTLDPVAAPPLTAELLAPFGDDLPEEVAARFIKIIDRYDAFEPAASREDVEREAALAAARFGPSRLALEASLILKTAEDPGLAVRRALAAVAARGVQPNEVTHAGDFISYLLAGRAPVRAATVEALASWRKRQDLTPVVDWVLAELEDDEREQVLA